ncbi:unnamed protein product [Rangifer tarandus platyrhynchus]|uniref:Uncharacterized protein n=1 Tax=Rangifer tarandus platyrhynchus TaxID=3082113 RepID=A0ABN8Z6B5_RANTA|nr:unnamed protein product [Rangifer tarandus platyrhynchus]
MVVVAADGTSTHVLVKAQSGDRNHTGYWDKENLTQRIVSWGVNLVTRYVKSESESEVAQSSPTLCDPWTVAHQAPLSMGFSRQEYWSGLPFPSPGDLPDPGIEPGSPSS